MARIDHREDGDVVVLVALVVADVVLVVVVVVDDYDEEEYDYDEDLDNEYALRQLYDEGRWVDSGPVESGPVEYFGRFRGPLKHIEGLEEWLVMRIMMLAYRLLRATGDAQLAMGLLAEEAAYLRYLGHAYEDLFDFVGFDKYTCAGGLTPEFLRNRVRDVGWSSLKAVMDADRARDYGAAGYAPGYFAPTLASG
jgi:hypothetical protein